jgi:hypothetical protein
MRLRRRYSVEPAGDGAWRVRRMLGGSVVLGTQQQAIGVARMLSDGTGGRIVWHNAAGRATGWDRYLWPRVLVVRGVRRWRRARGSAAALRRLGLRGAWNDRRALSQAVFGSGPTALDRLRRP